MKKQKINTHGLTLLSASHPRMKKIKKEHGEANLHGTKIWDSSFVLMDYFRLDPLPKETAVFDVGCGWGPMTLFLQKKFRSQVFSIDADESVEPYLREQCDVNGYEPLFWPLKINQIRRADLMMADTVVGCDICFWDSLRDDWWKLFKRAKKAGVNNILLADPGRTPFLKLADWAQEKYDAQLWSHAIRKPVKAKRYVLEINFD